MNRRVRWAHRLAGLAGLALLLAGAAAPQALADTPAGAASSPAGINLALAVTGLGTLGGSASAAHGINELGQVVGMSTTEAGDEHAFVWLPEPAYGLPAGMHDLGTLGGEESAAWAINDNGQISGYAEDANGDRRAFLWQNGAMQDLGTLGGDYSTGLRLNNAGHVVGAADLAEPKKGPSVDHAFVWDGAMHDLLTLGGASAWPVRSSGAADINEAGQAAGYSETADDPDVRRAVLFSGGTVHDLGTLDGAEHSEASGINDLGQVVGAAGNDAFFTAFLWLPEPAYGLEAGMHDLGQVDGASRSLAYEINNLGAVVGVSYFGSVTDAVAFLYQGSLFDLNDLLLPGQGWLLAQAFDINDRGYIVGQGVHNGQPRAFVARPFVPNSWLYLPAVAR